MTLQDEKRKIMNNLERKLIHDSKAFNDEALLNNDEVNKRLINKLNLAGRTEKQVMKRGFRYLPLLPIGIAAIIAISLVFNKNIYEEDIYQEKINLPQTQLSTILLTASIDKAIIDSLKQERIALSKDVESLKGLFVL
jgi:hypothetical protein